jgi:hypothetical protein
VKNWSDTNRSIAKPAKKRRKRIAVRFRAKSEMAPTCNVLREQEVDFTLAIQISWSRFWIMEHQCRRWGAHPLSLAVWIEKYKQTNQNYAELVRVSLKKMGCSLHYITVSVLKSASAKQDQYYPVNRLRNVALSKVKSSHSITMDADFLVSPDLYQNLGVHRAVLAKNYKIALVVPAFEIRSKCTPVESIMCRKFHAQTAPANKQELLQLGQLFKSGNRTEKQQIPGSTTVAKNSTLIPLKITKFHAGQSSTRYQTWAHQNANSLMPINSMHCMYEPYLVVRYCRDTPPFQEAFTGYGKNKISWIWHLRGLGYQLFQVGSAFSVHVPHTKSSAYSKWKSKKKSDQIWTKQRVKKITKAFKKWMKSNIPRNKMRKLSKCK